MFKAAGLQAVGVPKEDPRIKITIKIEMLSSCYIPGSCTFNMVNLAILNHHYESGYQ
jgi:hypothetical protein